MVTGGAAAAFERIQAEHSRCVWLDGGGARDWSRRRSVIGWLDDDDVSLSYNAAAREVTRHVGGKSVVVGDDPFAVLEAELNAGNPRDQWFGYFGYAARPGLPVAPDPDLPDAIWMRPSNLRSFAESGLLVHPIGSFGGAANQETRIDAPKLTNRRAKTHESAYRVGFDAVQEHLHAGNSYEVNLTYRLRVASSLSPAAAYLRLREVNPAPYAGYLAHDVDGARGWLLSSSPERYALITADRVIETRPIKGTTPRGTNPAEDAVARDRLATEAKYRSENLMIVDLLRNDLAMVSEVGSVDVPALMKVESYPSVHQLVSTVRGQLRDDVSTVGALKALFPAGSMTGAPKLRTMEIIKDVETSARGAYSGAFGWIAGDGRADLGVIIRSLMTADPSAGYLIGTGGGITVDSDVDDEWAETKWKAERLLHALRGDNG